MEWNHKDIWKFSDNKTFTVEVSRHQAEVPEGGCYDRDLGHRWCVYAYIYPTHPHFEKFDDTDHMWQEASSVMPFHGGPSYLRRHLQLEDGKLVTTSIQVGADYNHAGDWPHTRNATREDAYEVFADAEQLVNWLAANVPTTAQGNTQPETVNVDIQLRLTERNDMKNNMLPLTREEQLLRLAHLALWCMNQAHGDFIGDVDGGALQEKATELGILITSERTESCGEGCLCVETGFPTICYRPAEWTEPFEIQFGLH